MIDSSASSTPIFSPVNLTKAILPHFRERKAGFIVYVSSQVGWQAEPGVSSYCASKFALAGTSFAALFPVLHRKHCDEEPCPKFQKEIEY